MQSDHAKKTELDYPKVLAEHARKTMLLLAIPGLPGLLLMSVGNYQIDSLAGYAYAPAAICLLVTLVLGLQRGRWASPTVHRSIADAFAAVAVLGASFIVIRADIIGFDLTTSPIQFALFICLPLSFHKRSTGFVRNLVLTVLSMVVVGAYSSEVLSQVKMHYIFGFFAGTMIHLIAEDRMYKDLLYKRSLQREQNSLSKRSRLITKELQNRCLPHQLERMAAGFQYQETMPCYSSRFWASCLLPVTFGSDDEMSNQDIQHRNRMNDMIRKNIHDSFSVQADRRGQNQSETRFQNNGFLASASERKYLVTYNYPFPLKQAEEADSTILRSILLQFLVHDRVAQVFPLKDRAVTVCSLVKEEGYGVFSGSLNNYEIDGPVVSFCHQYLSARNQVPEIRQRIERGFHTIIMNEMAYISIRDTIENRLREPIRSFRITPHVRSDPQGTHIYTAFIDRQDVERLLESMEHIDSLNDRLAA